MIHANRVLTNCGSPASPWPPAGLRAALCWLTVATANAAIDSRARTTGEVAGPV